MFNFSEGNNFQDILQRMLDRIPDTLDKRQGSIIYDALAPAAAELAQCYIALDVYADQTYLLTAVGENLDNKVYDYGLQRNSATFAQRKATFTDTESQPLNIEIGSRWSIPVAYGGYNFEAIERLQDGEFVLQCETAGLVGNEYFGTLLPLDAINNLGDATLNDIYIAGQEEESDENLRQRAEEKINASAFGGNIDDYKQFTKDIDGVGDCLVIPVWDGGGTVKLIIVKTDYGLPEPALVAQVQTAVDPTVNSGLGYGMAPIGHKVTVTGPTELKVNIEGDIVLNAGFMLDTLKSDIEKAIKEYLLEVQGQWFTEESVHIYTARIITAVITNVPGVQNIDNIKINGSTDTLTINPLDGENQYPVLGEVTLNETK